MRDHIERWTGCRRVRVVLLVLLWPAVSAPAALADPRITGGPSIDDTTPQVGQTLNATATWQPPEAAAAYTWERCTGGSCPAIAVGPSYRVVEADVGTRLRVRLVVSDDSGSDARNSVRTAAVTPAPTPSPIPEPTPTPGATPSPPAEDSPAPDAAGTTAAPADPLALPVPAGAVLEQAAVRRPTLMRPVPTVRIKGRLSRTGARITLLTVRAPRGARISLRCSGRSCPAKRWARTTAITRLMRFERNLRAGTRLVITVTKPGRIGKHTTIVIRSGREPWRRDRCLRPGERTPTKCPAT